MIAQFTKGGALLGGLMLVGVPLSVAGWVPGGTSQRPEVKPKPVTVTGCLQKADEEGEFVITDKNGKKYELTSKSVALAEHVGHKVTVKGTEVAAKEAEKYEAKEEKNEAKEEKKEKAEKEEAHEHVQVTSLAMVSTKCS
jgi:hypothetical protein